MALDIHTQRTRMSTFIKAMKMCIATSGDTYRIGLITFLSFYAPELIRTYTVAQQL